MRSQKIKLTDLESGPIQQVKLSPELVSRIKAYRGNLGDADPGSDDEVIDSFRRDLHPEKEIAIWERIAHIFQNFSAGHDIADLARRREVLAALLLISSGADVLPTGTLTRQQIAELKYNF